jgi:hypothetical protein
VSFRDNAAENRYELDVGGVVSFADYRESGDVRIIRHVETPVEARGRGNAAQLMAAIVADAKARSLKLRALCPYAVAYFKRHPNEVASVRA